jgi:two-component system response regulator RegX3
VEGRATGEGTWKALVVDDEAPMRNVIALLLAREGYVVETAPDGVRALQMINAARGGMRAPYDVVVVDQVMPGLSGTQVAQTISAHSPRPPVVLATAFAYLIDPSALPPGVDVLVSKPFDARALREAIRAARAAVGRAD